MTNLEVETKLVPPPSFTPDLSGVVSGATIVQLPPLRLEAHYFDTADLALLRSGITVRHRSGPDFGHWTVKLPRTRGGKKRMTRQEIDLDGSVHFPPAEILGLLVAHLRGRTLLEVATLITDRAVLRLDSPQEGELLEVVEDRVLGTRPDGYSVEFDEIEVEQLQVPGAEQAGRETVEALRRAGCQECAQVPKVLRVLDPDRSIHAESDLPEFSATPSVQQIVTHALSRSVQQILSHDPLVRLGLEDEDLHQLRVAVRRLRSDLRTFDVVLDPQWSETIRHELGWLAGSTNTRRDLDVLRCRLTGYRDVLDSADLPSLEHIVQACDAEAEVARSQILEVLESERYLNLLSELVATVQTRSRCDLETQQDNDTQEHQVEREQLTSAIGHRWKQLEKQIGYLKTKPTAAGLHQTRIKAKRCRAAIEAVAPSVGSPAKKLAHSLAELQDVLGDFHDCEVAEAWCRRVAQEQPQLAFVAGQLVADTRRQEAQLVKKWPEVWRHSKKLHRRMNKAKGLRPI